MIRRFPSKHWTKKPGLWDPYVVARACIQVLMKDLYPRRKPVRNPTRDQPSMIVLKPCMGLSIYLEPLEEDPLIEKLVEEYIDYPCKMKLKNAISTGTKSALQFLLCYLRHKDPFLIGELNADLVVRYTSQGSSLTWANGQLRNIPELESCAATIIGRYLHYAVNLSVLHELYYLKDLLAKLWGPIFVGFKVTPQFEKSFSREKQIKLAIKTFTYMMEGIPWHQYKATEDMTRTLQETSTFYGIRYNDKLADEIERLSTLPQHYQTNMCDQSLSMTILDKYKERYQQNGPKESTPSPPSTNPYVNNWFPPDKCNIAYTEVDPGEQFL